MKPEELRIGNYVNLKSWKDETCFFSEFEATQDDLDNIVKHGKGYAKVLSISDDLELSAYGCDLDYYGCNEIEPIVLTEDWLDRLGFDLRTPISNKRFYQLVSECGKVFNVFDTKRVSLSLTHISCILYVHQLQNLYFALTNEELLITQ